MLIKDKLKELRKERNITQEAMAKELSVSRSTYAKWENGIRVPQKYYLEEIAKFYNISVYDILDVEDTKNLVITTNNKLNKTILGIILGFLTFLIIGVSILYFLKIYGTYCIDLIGFIDGEPYIYITYSLSDMENNYFPFISLVLNALFIIFAFILFFSYEKRIYKILMKIFIVYFVITITFIILTFLSGRFMLNDWLGDYLYVEV